MRGSFVAARHGGRGPSLVDEKRDVLGRDRTALRTKPRAASGRRNDPVPRHARFFSTVIRRRSKKRHSVPTPTATPFSASAVLISTRAMSGIASTSERISAACASMRPERRSPQRLRPRVALCVLARAPADCAQGAHAEAKRRLAARQAVSNSRENPRPQIGAKAPSTCLPASSPGRQLESAIRRFGNPLRFTQLGNRSKPIPSRSSCLCGLVAHADIAIGWFHSRSSWSPSNLRDSARLISTLKLAISFSVRIRQSPGSPHRAYVLARLNPRMLYRPHSLLGIFDQTLCN